MPSIQLNRAIRIINNQLNIYNKEPIDGLIFNQDEENTLKVNFVLIGPKDTPWDSCIINGSIFFPENYPFSPPSIKFNNNLYHPNIYKDGKVCLSILNSTQDETGYFQKSELWSPALDIRCVFLCILNLFTEPNLESPADLDSCIMYRSDQKKLYKIIRNEFNM
jgi:ubiquitin-protein ligase